MLLLPFCLLHNVPCQKVGRKLKIVELNQKKRKGFNIYKCPFSAGRWKGRRVDPFEKQCQQQNPAERESAKTRRESQHTGHTHNERNITPPNWENLHCLYITPFWGDSWIHTFASYAVVIGTLKYSTFIVSLDMYWARSMKKNPCFVVVNEKPSVEINHVTVICIVSLVFKPQFFIAIPYVLLCQKMNIRMPEGMPLVFLNYLLFQSGCFKCLWY